MGGPLTGPSGHFWFLDDEPSSRFPTYCRGNVGEIVPRPPTPLSTSITTQAFVEAFGSLLAETGVFTARELREPTVTGGVFGGYLYFNLSFARVFARRMPGMRVSDLDRQMMGAGALPPPEWRRGDRNPLLGARAVARLGLRSLRGRRPDLDAERRETRTWLAARPEQPTDGDVVALANGYAPRLVRNLRSLLDAGLRAGAPISLLERLAGRYAADRPGLVVRAVSGLGTIETARPAADLWMLGRQVAASATLTQVFDEGASRRIERLDAAAGSDDDVARFVAAFGAFLADHGHRGPNEVELASPTWATAPETALAAVDRLRLTDDAADPQLAAARLADERVAAVDELQDRVPRPLRPLVRRLLRTASVGTEQREHAKGTLVLDLHGLRGALHRTAERLVRRDEIPDRLSLFMVTIDELASFLADPHQFATVISDRRERYLELDRRVPPFWFEGRIPDPTTWPPRDEAPDADPEPGQVFRGITASSGAAAGRARIVTDPSDPRGLAPGDVLVAPITDPAWTPLFLAASAVVVEVGAVQSHAAIVARELGIPAVVSVPGATAIFRDGDVIHVDGDRALVRLVERAAPQT